jgi:NAD-dependent dihydropyrimidine dehydrogenase PreA subunit
MIHTSTTNTLRYNPELCSGCRMCTNVCPHGVFSQNGRMAYLVNSEVCMECGACQRNCPAGAITVDSGVGCAAAMIWEALTRRKGASCSSVSQPSCGCQ